jgi:hypothetical protein
MFLSDFFVALLIAQLLTAIFGGHRFGSAIFLFFVVLLFGTWAGGVWITPIGPPLGGVSWISFVFVGLFFALVLTALIPPARQERKPASVPPGNEGEASALVGFSIFFWILIGGLIVAIMTRYLVFYPA